jgi:hypothetical protein
VQGTPAAQSISWTRNGVSIAIDNSKYTGGNTANPSLMKRHNKMENKKYLFDGTVLKIQ